MSYYRSNSQRIIANTSNELRGLVASFNGDH
ncbi:MAG: hypothetical protein ACI9FR_003438, partial [Cryomorphaceae bacterium]